VAYPIEEKIQQNSMQTEVLRSTATEEIGQRDIRRIFKMLKEV